MSHALLTLAIVLTVLAYGMACHERGRRVQRLHERARRVRAANAMHYATERNTP